MKKHFVLAVTLLLTLLLTLSSLCPAAFAAVNTDLLEGSWYICAEDEAGNLIPTDNNLVLYADGGATIDFPEIPYFATGEWAPWDDQIVIWFDTAEIRWVVDLLDLSSNTATAMNGVYLIEQQMGLVFEKDPNFAGFITNTPFLANVTLADFNGTWSSFTMEYYGVIIPEGGQFIISIDNGVLNINKEAHFLTGTFSKGALYAIRDVDSDNPIIFECRLREGGILSCAISDYLTYFCEKTSD